MHNIAEAGISITDAKALPESGPSQQLRRESAAHVLTSEVPALLKAFTPVELFNEPRYHSIRLNP